MKLRALLLIAPATLSLAATPMAAPRFERVYPLKPAEGVFAYARISPDGKTLAYASETREKDQPNRVTQTVTVVDLPTRKVLFTEPGIDAYWSNDGKRMIFLSFSRVVPHTASRGWGNQNGVSIRDHLTGEITRAVAPTNLGDYFSWAVRDGKNLILTIQSNYYFLDGNEAVLPAATMPSCPGIGRGERPLISHDGQFATTFVRGTVVVRSLTDCSFIFDTGLQGAKADFSWDSRYVAFHTPKESGAGYDVVVVDVKDRTVRTVTNLPGSSYFPSWTKDGRLNFRYDGDDFRGFMTASNVLSAPARPLPASSRQVPTTRGWSDVFPETARPDNDLNLVLVWATWSAHTPIALAELQKARDFFLENNVDVGVVTATEPGSLQADIDRLIATHQVDLPRIPLAPHRLSLTEAQNQIPTTLLFKGNRLVDRKLGAQSFEELRDWVEASTSVGSR
jgi:hypothetical protein